jgi:Zn finger protein HypA/HybF involved in hydrogenase expression
MVCGSARLTMAGQEQFECQDCYHVGSLDVHGACEECHSQAVWSVELHGTVAALAIRPIASLSERTMPA